ncbi:MAG: hypothetical protein AAF828_09160 [Bacteroidota bacterium]
MEKDLEARCSTSDFARIAQTCVNGMMDLTSRGMTETGEKQLRLFSTWEITKYLIPVAQAHFRRVLKTNPTLPQGKSETDGGAKWFRELQSSQLLPILIGCKPQLFRAQYQAYQEMQRQLSVVMIDQYIRLTPTASKAKTHVLNPAVHSKRKRFYHLSHLGAQQHLVDPAVFQLLTDHHFEYVRLGAARQNIQELEPLIRDADLVGLDISAVKYFEAPAQEGYFPSGFDLAEATQLCRYAGISDKLTSFGIYGVDPTADENDQTVTAAAYAQLIWYFIDGFKDRKGDFPLTNKGLIEYVVDLQQFDRITFWKSPRSGRWWIQAPAGKKNGEERHRLIPCSPKDYQDACNQQLPDRLIQAFRRYT